MFKNLFQHRPNQDELKQMTTGKTAQERKEIYRELGVSPSGVIDGVYNDTNLPVDGEYNDADRDWDVDA
jgi:hypothetical protein